MESWGCFLLRAAIKEEENNFFFFFFFFCSNIVLTRILLSRKLILQHLDGSKQGQPVVHESPLVDGVKVNGHLAKQDVSFWIQPPERDVNSLLLEGIQRLAERKLFVKHGRKRVLVDL